MDAKTWIALVALFVSAATAIGTLLSSWAEARKAEVGAYFHWLPGFAEVLLPSGETRKVGYHLVLYNRGPHRATNVNFKAKMYGRGELAGWQDIELADVVADEFPLETLDRGVRYPIPWTLTESGKDIRKERRVLIELEWHDARGQQKRRVPLRRGNIGGVGL